MPPFVHIGLIVTGRGEESFLPFFLGSLGQPGPEGRECTFEVIRRIGQLNPITSEPRIARMVGTGQAIPNKDQVVGQSARAFLAKRQHSFVILLDDLEHNRREQIDAAYRRYGEALDTVQPEKRWRTSVHFFITMIEAYYFADAHAINAVLGLTLEDWPVDVETIRHPKNDLKKYAADLTRSGTAARLFES